MHGSRPDTAAIMWPSHRNSRTCRMRFSLPRQSGNGCQVRVSTLKHAQHHLGHLGRASRLPSLCSMISVIVECKWIMRAACIATIVPVGKHSQRTSLERHVERIAHAANVFKHLRGIDMRPEALPVSPPRRCTLRTAPYARPRH